MGVYAGVLFGIRHSFNDGILWGASTTVIAGVVFGGPMSLIFVTVHKRLVRRISNDTSPETMGVHHVRRLELSLSYGTTFDVCLEALRSIKGCRVRDSDRSLGSIEAKTGSSWKTLGDSISIVVHEIGKGLVHVKISSEPLLRTTMLDFGRNLDNVQKICQFLIDHKEKTVPSEALKLAVDWGIIEQRPCTEKDG